MAAQIDAVFEDLGFDAMKIGMLSNAGIVIAVAERLTHHGAGTRGGPPVVLDPVMVAKSGDALLADEAVAALVEHLLPLANVITPNLPEAQRLWREVGGKPAAAAAEAQASRTGDAQRRGWRPKPRASSWRGGWPTTVPRCWSREATAPAKRSSTCSSSTARSTASPRRASTAAPRTAPAYPASAIAARLGGGESLPRAVERAIGYLRRAMETASPLGGGHGQVNHLTPPQ